MKCVLPELHHAIDFLAMDHDRADFRLTTSGFVLCLGEGIGASQFDQKMETGLSTSPDVRQLVALYGWGDHARDRNRQENQIGLSGELPDPA